MNLNNHWLSVDRAYEDKQAYLESVQYLAETAYDQAHDQAKELMASVQNDVYLLSGFMANTTVGEIDIDFKDILVNYATITYDDCIIIDEVALWKIAYEATENYIEKQKGML